MGELRGCVGALGAVLPEVGPEDAYLRIFASAASLPQGVGSRLGPVRKGSNVAGQGGSCDGRCGEQGITTCTRKQ